MQDASAPNLDEKAELYRSRNMKDVENIMGYNFKCKARLIQALTHKSNNFNKFKADKRDDYEGLSLLGKSVL